MGDNQEKIVLPKIPTRAGLPSDLFTLVALAALVLSALIGILAALFGLSVWLTLPLIGFALLVLAVGAYKAVALEPRFLQALGHVLDQPGDALSPRQSITINLVRIP